MPELSPKEKLQPSLLDRLTDDEPDRRQEGPDKRYFTLERLRTMVKRDLAWLLNTCNLAATDDLRECPEVAASVLNYGIPDLTGRNLSGVDVESVERLVRQAVLSFEPRILRHSVRVQAKLDTEEMSHNALTFEIHGELWAEPVPVDIVLRTDFDLETGLVSVRD